MNYRIPFNKSFVTGRELGYVDDVLRNHSTSGDGVYSKKCQALMEQIFSANKVLLTTSCTSALEMSVLLCDLKAGDEVILPSFTFVSTADAFALRGTVPVFVDIEPTSLNFDPDRIAAAVTNKTRAICVVHYGVVVCDMKASQAVASEHSLENIEDAAKGVGAPVSAAWDA